MVLMRCARCARQVAETDLKRSAQRTLLCGQCRNELPKTPAETRVVQSAEQTRKRYFCTSCSFHFTRAAIVPVNCPYCGKQGTVVDDKDVASGRLLDDS